MPVPPSTSQYHLVTHSWANWTIFSFYNSFVVDRCPHPVARRWAGNQPSCPQNQNKNQYQQLSLWTAGNGLFTVRQLLGIYWIHSHTWELSFFYRDETLTNFFMWICSRHQQCAVQQKHSALGSLVPLAIFREVRFIEKGPWAKTVRVQTAIIIRNADFIINWGEEERLLLSNKYWAH